MIDVGTGLLEIPKGTTPATYMGVIAGATAAFNRHRRVPSVEEIFEHCQHSKRVISRIISTPEFKTLMRLRGYPFDTVTRLTPEQTFAVAIITDPSNRKPLNVKLKQAGITYAQYRAWLKQEHFRNYITKLSEDMLGEHVADVHTRVLEKASNGDMAAIRLYYELTGRHDPQKQQVVDLNGVIGLLLEIINRYVTDTKQLAAISTDIDTVLSGGIPKALTQFDVSHIAQNTDDIIDGVVVHDTKPATDFKFDFEDI